MTPNDGWCCGQCHADLASEPSGVLRCEPCGLQFQIRDGYLAELVEEV